MHEFLFFAFLSWAIVLIAVILMTGAYRKFLDGQLKSILRWIILAMWFMAVPYTIFILRDAHFLDGLGEEISYIIYGFMIITSIFLIKGALSLVEFSNVFGFADLKKRFIEKKKQKTRRK